MAGWLIIVVGLIYLVTGISLIMQGKTGMAIMFFAYAVGNIGIWMDCR